MTYNETIETLESRIKHKRKVIINDAKRIAEELITLAKRMENDASRLPNSLGVLQSTGTIFDVECGTLCALTEALNLIKGNFTY